jgi:predicted esterase
MKKNKLRYGDIIAESYYLEKNNGKAIIFCSGIPGTSSYVEIAKKYVDKGFIFIHPKYLGSWESYGNFSVENCKKTIVNFVNALKNKEVKTIFSENFDLEINEIYLFGHSFGGSVALCSGAELAINGIIALAPVIDYRIQGKETYEEEKMDLLYCFIIAGFENVYRNFDKSEWKNFCSNGSILNANDYLGKLKEKRILLIHGTKDISVNYNRSKKFYLELKNFMGEIDYEETKDNHSNIKLNSFEKVISWIKR